MNTHGLICDFGKHKDTPWTRVPVGYLTWMLSEPKMPEERKAIARAELERRGSVIPKIIVSGHAIDRASLSCRKIWHQTRENDEGLHAWLVRMAQTALAMNDRLPSGKYAHEGMKFVFETDGDIPVLKTVMPGGEK